MCGIVGILGRDDVVPGLLRGLRRLEYRGYDSAGVAVLVDGEIQRRRCEGKIERLHKKLKENPLSGVTGIGHTRWATHGVPNERNAHPHATDRVAVVHNGIIENFQALREELGQSGHTFESETDSEVVVQLVTRCLEDGDSPRDAVYKTLKRLEGAFGLCFLFAHQPDLMIAARKGSPLAVGYGDGEMFVGSDALALAPMTRRICYLEDGDWAVITPQKADIMDFEGNPVSREIRETVASGAMIGKGGYRHFMQKEIFEQPQVIGDTLNSMFNPAERTITLPDIPFDLSGVEKLTMVACGTSHYASHVARYWVETLARIPVEIDVASEFRYRQPPMAEGGMALFISQSGETADTLAALRYCREQGQKIVSIVNVPESTIARESDCVFPTLAGPEIGVASTKAFTTQLIVLSCLAIALGRARGTLSSKEEEQLSRELAEVPARAAEVLNHDEKIREIAHSVAEARDVLYLGRGTGYPVAMEGALKLKEISYIHAEGYAAGEMKHGPIALIDEDVPVVVVAPTDPLFEKTVSNMQEVSARGGRIVFFSDSEGVRLMGDAASASVELPLVSPFVAPLL